MYVDIPLPRHPRRTSLCFARSGLHRLSGLLLTSKPRHTPRGLLFTLFCEPHGGFVSVPRARVCQASRMNVKPLWP
jgi:hypothetical protein